jgi:hypothetical protein
MLSFQYDEDDSLMRDAYRGYTVAVLITILLAVLLCVVVPVALWIHHRRLYAHYNAKDHRREQRRMWHRDNEEDEEDNKQDQQQTSQQQQQQQQETELGGSIERTSSEASTRLSSSNDGQPSQDGQEDQAPPTSIAATASPPSRNRLTSPPNVYSQSIQLRFYNASWWTQHLQPDTAMKQLLVLWYISVVLLLLGLSLTLSYMKARAGQHAVRSQLSDYYGPMPVHNVTILSGERVMRYRWDFYRVFEAQPQLQVSWECQDPSTTKIWECNNVHMLYEPCLRGHSCHRYLQEAEEEDEVNSIHSLQNDTGFCLEVRKQETIRKAQECVDDVLQQDTTAQPTIVLYGDCETCTAYAEIPSRMPRFQTRLVHNGIFFIIMGLLALIGWYRTHQRFKSRFMPLPPGVDTTRRSSSDSELQEENTETPRFQILRRPRRRQPSSNNPLQNRLRNLQARQAAATGAMEVQEDLPPPVRTRMFNEDNDTETVASSSTLSTSET